MALAPKKTLAADLFHPAKRLKSAISASPSASRPEQPAISALSPEQRTRIDINKALAVSKCHIRLCTVRIHNAKAAGASHVKLEDLLVDDSWLEALPGSSRSPMPRTRIGL